MILMLNCSYKAKDSNTQYFLELLKKELGAVETEIINIRHVLNGGFYEFIDNLTQAEAFVIGTPLYVDGLPAQAVKLLEMLLEAGNDSLSGKRVYVVSNLGFYEGAQICNLFEISNCVYKDENGYSDRQNRVQNGQICKSHHSCSH